MINQQLSLRIPQPLYKRSIKKAKLYGFTSVQEYIKDVLRQDLYIPEKVHLSPKEKKNMIETIKKLHGSSKLRTTDEDLHKIREQIADEIEEELRVK